MPTRVADVPHRGHKQKTEKEALLNQIPLKRLGQPSDIADAVGFLCSEKAGYITGHVLHVNGGMHMA